MSTHECKHCDHTNTHKQIAVIDKFLGTLNKPTISKTSEFNKNFDNKKNDNPFFSHEKLTKRKNKHRAQIRKVSKAWKKEFNKRYNDAKGPQFALGKDIAKDDFTELQRAKVLNGLVKQDDLALAIVGAFVGEMEHSFKEVLTNTVDVAGMNKARKNAKIGVDAIEEYTTYNQKLAGSLSEWLDTQLKKIVAYGIEDGDSTNKIANKIRKKFDFYTDYEAERIARTESIRASSRGAIFAYKELDVEYYEVLPAVNACPICIAKADRNPYKIDDKSGRPVFHPNCRCSVIPVLEGIEKMIREYYSAEMRIKRAFRKVSGINIK